MYSADVQNSKKTISIIMPIFNGEDSVAFTADCLQSQTLHRRAIEIILVNDGSTDSTLEVCRRLAAEADNITVIDKPR